MTAPGLQVIYLVARIDEPARPAVKGDVKQMRLGAGAGLHSTLGTNVRTSEESLG